MKFYLIILLTFCIGNMYAKSYKIEYKDTDKTYLQISILDSTANEYIDGNVIFLDANPKVKSTTKLDSVNVDHLQKSKAYEFKSGIYNLKLSNFNNFQKEEIDLKNVEIIENKLNKLTIHLKQGILQFRYTDYPTIPVNYKVTVIKRKSSSPKSIYIANEARHFSNGEYYIEINTIPIYKVVISLDYESTYEIQVRKEGRLKINKEQGVSNVEVYKINDPSHILPIDYINWNDQTIYPIVMLPARYKVIWGKNEQRKEEIVNINSNQLTEFTCD